MTARSPVEFGMHGFLCYAQDEVFDRLADLTWDAGFRWLREGFPWRALDVLDTDEDWQRVDRRIDALVERGFKILGVVGSGAAPDGDGVLRTMPPLRDWEEFVRGIVNRFGDRVAAWEVHNEPNYERFWQPEPNAAEYAALLASTYETIRAEGHEGPIVAMSLAFCDLDFLEAVLAAGGSDYADIVSLHPYSIFGAPEPAGVREGVQAVVDLLRGHSIDPRIWITEIGWSTWPTGLFSMSSEQAAADFQVRAHALLMSIPEVETVFVHTLRDGPLYPGKEPPRDTAQFMDHLGIVNEDTTPKLPYHAARTTIAELGGQRVERRLTTAPDVFAYELSSEGRRSVVAWTTGDVWTLLLPSDAKEHTVTDVVGRRVCAWVEDGVLDLRVGPSPLFVRLEG